MQLGLFLLLCCFIIPFIQSLHQHGMEYPHVVAIMDGNNFTCQGINFAGNVVITAAYCVPKDKVFEIRTGFTTPKGSLQTSSFKTTSTAIVPIEWYNTSLADENIALVYLKDTIPVTAASKPADIVSCSSPLNMTSCVIIFWNVKSELQQACAALISVPRGMCLNSSIGYEHINPREKFCGKTKLCLPDTTGAPLTCGQSVVGMVVKSACRDKNRGTELVFINLGSALHRILAIQEQEKQSDTLQATEKNLTNIDLSATLQYTPKKPLNGGRSIFLCWKILFLSFLFISYTKKSDNSINYVKPF